MMTRPELTRILMLGALWVLAGPAAFAQVEHPAQTVVRTATEALLGSAAAGADRGALCVALERSVAPHLALDAMSRRVLGSYWDSASESQRAAFSLLLARELTDAYAGVIEGHRGRPVTYLPTRVRSLPERVTVRTEVAGSGWLRTPVYFSMRRDQGDWKVYDVAANGVSILALYRATFAGELSQSGLDGLLARLDQRALEAGCSLG